MSNAVMGDLRRDIRVMGLIGVAHGLSHFYQTVLLLILSLKALRDGFGADFVTLSAVGTVFYVVSGFGQFAAGFVVDRFGARLVLLFGLTMAGLGIAGLGLATEYWHLIAFAIVAGCGNAVFHPADYAILNASVHNSRLGRSYSMHSLLGTLGWAAAPMLLLELLIPEMGWRTAVVVLGVGGPLLAAVLATQSGYFLDHRGGMSQGHDRSDSLMGLLSRHGQMLMQAPIVMCFGYFTLIALTIVGLQAAAIPSLGGVYGLSENGAGFALTAMLLAGAVGVGVGGFVADKLVVRHEIFASFGMLLAGVFMTIVASGILPPWLVWVGLACVGFSASMTTPSRDMIVRAATPPGASGKVFGFVYSGLDAGSAISPTLFGFLLSMGMPSAVLYLVAAFYVASVVTVLNIRRLSTTRMVPAQ